MSSGTRGPSQYKKKQPEDDRLYLSCFAFCSDGSVYDGQVFHEEVLVQIQMTCSAVPSPIYKMQELVQKYAQSTTATAGERPVPEDVAAIADRYHTQFTYVSKRTPDPDRVGLKRNRSGWYVSQRNLKGFLMYFDDLLFFRKTFVDDEFDALDPDLHVVLRVPAQLRTHCVLDPKEDELLCTWSTELETAETKWPVDVFDLCPPPGVYPPRFVLMTLELTSSDKMNVIFSGNTKPFQANFTEEGIKLKTQKTSASTYAEYYRVLEHVRLQNDVTPCVENLADVFTKVLCGSPVVVQINNNKHDTELAQQVLQKLAALPNVVSLD